MICHAVGMVTMIGGAAGQREISESATVREIDTMVIDTEIGPMVAAVCEHGLLMAGIAGETVSADAMLADTTVDLARRHRHATLTHLDDAATSPYGTVIAALRSLAAGVEPDELPPLHLVGTAFQIRVWEQLRRIEHGEVCSYGEVAAAIGAPSSVRATAGAVGANPIGLIVPCHRVIRADGTIGGFGWGTETKRRLLAAEGVHLVDDPGTPR